MPHQETALARTVSTRHSSHADSTLSSDTSATAPPTPEQGQDCALKAGDQEGQTDDADTEQSNIPSVNQDSQSSPAQTPTLLSCRAFADAALLNTQQVKEIWKEKTAKEVQKARLQWGDRETRLMLEAILKVEESQGEELVEQKRGGKIQRVPVKTGDNQLHKTTQAYIAWNLRMYGNESFRNVDCGQVKNHWTKLKGIWDAIQKLSNPGRSGGPFLYDRERGYANLDATMGALLDSLIEGDVPQGHEHAHLVKTTESQKQPDQAKDKESQKNHSNHQLDKTLHQENRPVEEKDTESPHKKIKKSKQSQTLSALKAIGDGNQSLGTSIATATENEKNRIKVNEEMVAQLAKANTERRNALLVERRREAGEVISTIPEFQSLDEDKQFALQEWLLKDDNSEMFCQLIPTLRAKWLEKNIDRILASQT
ncbi:hypothetical protein QFC22_003522 [Naganishia vaughanmartiniae]|uniref:Uncharacterized protein n=1 Tax=Naganishia vaughanmartiniae TaxID=1424756 RepID=A0ACC2X539_9TREE|nr:hypothetical protein QFC22_003522 [Naganishia vaughanmartiniae]